MKCMNLSMIMFLSSGLKMQCAKKIPIQGRMNQRLFPRPEGGKVKFAHIAKSWHTRATKMICLH